MDKHDTIQSLEAWFGVYFVLKTFKLGRQLTITLLLLVSIHWSKSTVLDECQLKNTILDILSLQPVLLMT